NDGNAMTIERRPMHPRKPAASSGTGAAPATPLAAHPVPPRLGPDIGMPQALRSRRPDQATRAFLRLLNLVQSLVSQESIPLNGQREVVRLAGLAYGRRPEVAEVSERTIDGPGGPIALRIFAPTQASKPRPAFLWCHGGGFVVGGLDTAESICRQLALQADCIAIAVRYRLAPEHDLIAGREDFLAALRWVAEHGAQIGVDPTRLAIGGDSAGGNISAAVAQACLNQDGPRLSLQVLAYPVTDLVHEFPSHAENVKGGYLLNEEVTAWIRGLLSEQVSEGLTDPRLSPRRRADLRGLAPALVITAGFDPLRDDGLDYTARLRTAGVPVELLHYAGQIHGFLNFDTVIGAARDALERVSSTLATTFGGTALADRTVEIADAPGRPRPLGRHLVAECSSTALLLWIASERWSYTLLDLAAPGAARSMRRWMGWTLAPALGLRRMAISRLDRLAARQTHPPRPAA
ncbi:MAG TPA: alpha/beta hydrolase fold domain-containing protein, partial [Ramlibacter sp.]|nr:alpha/beta hydrolase fold domain-containing protein [Ramlibacter sp.]